MPRQRTVSKSTNSSVSEQPVIIHENGVYTSDQVRRLLGLKADTLGREIKLGRIRVSKRSGRHYFLGAWILAWIESGEILPSRDGAGAVEGAPSRKLNDYAIELPIEFSGQAKEG